MELEAARTALIDGAVTDFAVRGKLAASGALFEGYHPEMEAVHLDNARLLDRVIEAHGWPDRRRFGDEGAAAAFVILQHAISRPDLQRRGLELIVEAVERGEANAIDAAYLADRIAVMEGRAQRFGTHFDWDDAGQLSPAPMREPETIDERRAQIGLPPMADTIAHMRARAAAEGETAPADYAARRAAFEDWAKSVGWRA